MTTSKTTNEGEGSRTAAKAYNEATEAFVQQGKVKNASREAVTALESSEAADLKEAEQKGCSHVHEEDPRVHRG